LRTFLAASAQHQFDPYLERIQCHETVRGLMRVVTPTGDERVLTYHNRLIGDTEVSPYVLGHAQDITDRVHAETALRARLGLAGTPVPFVEAGIAASVLVLGAIVALGVRAPVAVAMAVVAAFAIFHGHAHGTELPTGGSIAAYAAGFVLATALLHAAGVTLGLMIGRFSEAYGRVGFRLSGGLVALAGGAILLHAI
jgi:hypothetical protein